MAAAQRNVDRGQDGRADFNRLSLECRAEALRTD
jgi:hypothetical protein